MKNNQDTTPRGALDKGRPDYYLTPTHDFTQYTRDCEEKYWNRETAFDWGQNVRDNLRDNLERLSPEAFSRVTFMVLPMVKEMIAYKLEQIRQRGLPLEEDALKDIAEGIPFEGGRIQQALAVQAPLKVLQSAFASLKDQLEILQREQVDLREQQRLELFREGAKVRHLETEAEKQAQAAEIAQLAQRISQVEGEYRQQNAQYKTEAQRLEVQIRDELRALEPQVRADLEAAQELIERTLQSRQLPADAADFSRIKDLILKRQLRGLKDIANHALVVEQSAIAPLTMGIIHYKRYREIQEAMTTFINDEAKHSATFRRFLVEKLEAKEYISGILIRGADRYMWLARFLPATGMFLAVIVESIGAAYLEFFGEEKYMPDQLFRSICKTISVQDEKRHIDLCVAMYNELFWSGTRWERLRNHAALTTIMKSVYGDKTDDHHLIQAFRAFGVESDHLYRHIVGRLSEHLARINMAVKPERLLEIIGRG
jgi:hypothetical protein